MGGGGGGGTRAEDHGNNTRNNTPTVSFTVQDLVPFDVRQGRVIGDPRAPDQRARMIKPWWGTSVALVLIQLQIPSEWPSWSGRELGTNLAAA